jgi:HSP20 family protein
MSLFGSYINSMQSRFHDWWMADPFVELDRELRRAKKPAHITSTEKKDQVQVKDATKAAVPSHPRPQEDPFQEQHEMMQRSMVNIPTEEEQLAQAWEEHHKEMERALLENRPPSSHKLDTFADLFARTPRVHVIQRQDDYVLVTDVPGVKKEDIAVDFIDAGNGNHLVKISGARKNMHQTEKGNTFVSQKVYGEFQRTIRLPQGADLSPESLKVEYDNGTISIRLPRSKEPDKPVVPRTFRLAVV